MTGKMEMECKTDKGLGIGIIMVELFAVEGLFYFILFLVLQVVVGCVISRFWFEMECVRSSLRRCA